MLRLLPTAIQDRIDFISWPKVLQLGILGLWEQVRALSPVIIIILLFHALFLHGSLHHSAKIAFGLILTAVGLMLFIFGLYGSFLPLAEDMGRILPAQVKQGHVVLISGILGALVTIAEPAIGSLSTVGAHSTPHGHPYVYALLNFDGWNTALLLAVAFGVSIAGAIGTLRNIKGWTFGSLLIFSCVPTLLFSALLVMWDRNLASIVALAFDSGAVTTGPVTVPSLLAMGIGLSAHHGKENDALGGFGLVTLASLFPILTVELLGVFIWLVRSPSSIENEAIRHHTAIRVEKNVFIDAMITSARAVLPMVVFFVVIFRYVLHRPFPQVSVSNMLHSALGMKVENKHVQKSIVWHALLLTWFGMVLFNMGRVLGLELLGAQVGEKLPFALQGVWAKNLFISGVFGLGIGCAATLAEPGLHVLGDKVQKLSQFSKWKLIFLVAAGVAFGLALGVIRLQTKVGLMMLLGVLYAVALLLTFKMPSERQWITLVAWDSAGVTTGPITSPLVLALGVALGGIMHQSGFGLLSLASVGPICSTLLGSLIEHKWKMKRGRASSVGMADALWMNVR